MTIAIGFLVLLLNISFNNGALPIIPYKCWSWDSACLMMRAQAVVPALTAGIPEIGTERLDPMFIDLIHIDQDGLKLHMRNVYIQGLSNAIIDKISVDQNSRLIRLVFHADFSIKSQYTAGGYLFSLPVIGQGDFAIRYNDVHMEMSIPFEVIKDINGKNIINLKGYQYWYDVRGGGLHSFNNLYYGDKKSSDRMHALLNQNWKVLSTRFGRHIYDKINDKIFNAIRTFMRAQPLEKIFLY